MNKSRITRRKFSQTAVLSASTLALPGLARAQQGYPNRPIRFILAFGAGGVPDMPFAGMAVNRNWASENPKVVERFLSVFVKSIAWFEDTKNRDEAVKLMVTTSRLKQEDVERSYDFLRGKHLFEPTSKVSRAKLNVVLDALRELGDVPASFAVERLFLPSVTQVVD